LHWLSIRVIFLKLYNAVSLNVFEDDFNFFQIKSFNRNLKLELKSHFWRVWLKQNHYQNTHTHTYTRTHTRTTMYNLKLKWNGCRGTDLRASSCPWKSSFHLICSSFNMHHLNQGSQTQFYRGPHLDIKSLCGPQCGKISHIQNFFLIEHFMPFNDQNF
jgi:hypothetical protein